MFPFIFKPLIAKFKARKIGSTEIPSSAPFLDLLKTSVIRVQTRLTTTNNVNVTL
jgi:hypothetical protein